MSAPDILLSRSRIVIELSFVTDTFVTYVLDLLLSRWFDGVYDTSGGWVRHSFNEAPVSLFVCPVSSSVMF
jgi:hypothetical protein